MSFITCQIDIPSKSISYQTEIHCQLKQNHFNKQNSTHSLYWTTIMGYSNIIGTKKCLG